MRVSPACPFSLSPQGGGKIQRLYLDGFFFSLLRINIINLTPHLFLDLFYAINILHWVQTWYRSALTICCNRDRLLLFRRIYKIITLNFHGFTAASAPQARLGFGELTCCGGVLSSRVSLRDGGRWSLDALVGVEAELC